MTLEDAPGRDAVGNVPYISRLTRTDIASVISGFENDE